MPAQACWPERAKVAILRAPERGVRPTALQSTVVSKAQNYWLKITGASEMHTRGVKVFMINGQGRWRLHAQEPGDMVYKYWQSSLLEKIATSNF